MAALEEELNNNGYVVHTNKGNSMSPLIKEGRDALVIRSQNGGFRKNDVVLYKTPKGQYVLHRIRKVTRDGFFIIGDHCTEGETVRAERIIGVLDSIKRDGKTVPLKGFSYKMYVFSLPLRRFAIKVRRKLRSGK